MKTTLIVLSVVVILGALVYLIVKANRPTVAPVVEVTTPPSTLVQPVYVVRGSEHTHPVEA